MQHQLQLFCTRNDGVGPRPRISSLWLETGHFTTLHSDTLPCTVLHCIALHDSALHCIALHCKALHCPAVHIYCSVLYYRPQAMMSKHVACGSSCVPVRLGKKKIHELIGVQLKKKDFLSNLSSYSPNLDL